ncbi:succinyl-diaminopimelate desuccinylase [Changpingibacter yushuensis]|uniref:succinyl-diaminopimelate desuccinylase n=1 Tax=Changpingibacter yushuensis TaxID=2758440 RepID=UPI00165EAE60|nr:succinyl-diaminopimelate desuccinylase [Changpingibacter yushuensis]
MSENARVDLNGEALASTRPSAAELGLAHDVVELTAALVDIPSVSGEEHLIADAVEREARTFPHLEILRDEDTVVARTHFGRPARVVLAGHLDTVPIAGNVPGRRDGEFLWGRGTVDMKAGCAVFLQLMRELREPRLDITWIFYDHEEVAANLNGLGRVLRLHPHWLEGDVAILGEPTNGGIEAGCNGTMRLSITAHGKAAHSARPWTGSNAVHALGEVLRRLEEWPLSVRNVGGLDYRESLLAVGISGGGPRNIVPDEAAVIVNFRFAPDRSERQAENYVRSLFADLPVTIAVTDSAPAADPGTNHSELDRLSHELELRGAGPVAAKLGWTDVARFSALGMPAINCGPGDPLLAHQDEEACSIEQIRSVYRAFTAWLQ